MKKVKLLDCTLRDGGSLNKYEFGYNNINKIINNLNNAGVDIIEIGFFQDNIEISVDKTISSNPILFTNLIKKTNNKKIKAVIMIECGKFNIDNLPASKETLIYGIRLMFKKKDLNKVLDLSFQLKEKGYSISLNPVSITTYNDNDIKFLLKKANELNPEIIYIVDTYGLMNKEMTLKYFNQFNQILNNNIEIGYHAHNNLQLAYSNAVEIINNSKNRTIVIDGSLYGMGKRAGNTNTELIAEYLNINYKTNYNINIITDTIEKIILPLHKKFEWGYSLIHYTAAINKCHSDYVSYLYNEKKINYLQINKILEQIEENQKLTFNKTYIENLLTLQNLTDCKRLKQPFTE